MFFWIAAISLFLSFVLIKPLLSFLESNGFVAKNFENKIIPIGSGLLWLAVLYTGLAVLILVEGVIGAIFPAMEDLFPLAFLMTGAALLGLIDDKSTDVSSKGLKGHIKAFLSGKITSGFIKAFGGLILSLIVVSGFSGSLLILAVNTLVVSMSMNFINLLDLRPGRALTVYIVAANILMLFALANTGFELPPIWNFWGVFLAPAAALFISDVKGSSMLGDTGSNLIGAVLGFMTAVTFGVAVKFAILVVLIIFTLFADSVSISKLLEKNKKTS